MNSVEEQPPENLEIETTCPTCHFDHCLASDSQGSMDIARERGRFGVCYSCGRKLIERRGDE